LQRNCDYCGKPYEAKRVTSKFAAARVERATGMRLPAIGRVSTAMRFFVQAVFRGLLEDSPVHAGGVPPEHVARGGDGHTKSVGFDGGRKVPTGESEMEHTGR
jgi:hypothetical protein